MMHETVSESFPCVEGKFCGWENQQNNITTFIKMQTDTWQVDHDVVSIAD